QAEMHDLSGGNAVVVEVATHMASYISWMQWALWDMPVLGVGLDAEPGEFRDAVVGCGLAYLAIRAFDDVIDDHFSYKGRRNTVFGSATESYPRAQDARALSTLAALMLCLDGLERLTGANAAILPATLRSLSRAVVGAMMEFTAQPEWTRDDYVRM